MRSSLYFLLACSILFAACIDAYEVLPEETETEIYDQYRGTIEMVGENTFILGGSNSAEYDADIEILMLLEKGIIFKSQVFFFDLDESNIYGADPCNMYGAHCADGSMARRIIFEPDPNFWECFYESNCDPGDEVFWFELGVRYED